MVSIADRRWAHRLTFAQACAVMLAIRASLEGNRVARNHVLAAVDQAFQDLILDVILERRTRCITPIDKGNTYPPMCWNCGHNIKGHR